MGTIGGRVGCGAALVAGLLVFVPLGFFLFYGDCVGDPRCGEGDGLYLLLLLAVTASVAATVGIGVRTLVNWLAGPEM